MLVHIEQENNTIPIAIAPANVKVQDLWDAIKNVTPDGSSEEEAIIRIRTVKKNAKNKK